MEYISIKSEIHKLTLSSILFVWPYLQNGETYQSSKI